MATDEHTVKRAAMIYNVLGQLGYYHKLIKEANTYFEQNNVDPHRQQIVSNHRG